MSTSTGIPEWDSSVRFSQARAPIESADLVRRFPSRPSRFSFEPSSRWVRGIVAETAVVDSRSQFLIWEPHAKVPEYLFPRAHVRTDLLVPSETFVAPGTFYRPQTDRAHWYDLRLGDRVVPHAAWRWDVAGLEDYLTLNWFPGVFDAWYEEDELVHTHPRDPNNRVDAIASSRHVEVYSRDGTLLADTHAPVAVYETGLPVRYYLPPEDVRFGELDTVETRSSCPYKGHTSGYWSVRGGGDPVAWSYAEPTRNLTPVTDHIAFYQERTVLIVDGITS